MNCQSANQQKRHNHHTVEAAPQVINLNYKDPSSAEAILDKRNTQGTKGNHPKSGINYPCVIRMSMASITIICVREGAVDGVKHAGHGIL